MKYSFLKFIENKMSSSEDEEPIPIIVPASRESTPKMPNFPSHLKVGDHVMVDPHSNRYKNVSKDDKLMFKKTYGEIIEYPKDGKFAGMVKVKFHGYSDPIDKYKDKAMWFLIGDLFVRPLSQTSWPSW